MQDALNQHDVWTVARAHQRPKFAKTREARSTNRTQPNQVSRGNTTISRPTTTGFQRGNNTTFESWSNVGEPRAKHQPNGLGINCFKCGAPGHKSAQCRKENSREGKQLLVEECDEETGEELPIYDEDDEDSVVYGDVG